MPNFALGAVLLMRFAAEASRHYEHAEIIETHEKGKIDAPSGTSLRTARLMAEAPGSALAAPPGAGQASRGLVADDRVTIHSVRLPGAWRTRKSCSEGRTNCSRCATTRCRGVRSWAACSSPCAASAMSKGAVVGLENLLD